MSRATIEATARERSLTRAAEFLERNAAFRLEADIDDDDVVAVGDRVERAGVEHVVGIVPADCIAEFDGGTGAEGFVPGRVGAILEGAILHVRIHRG